MADAAALAAGLNIQQSNLPTSKSDSISSPPKFRQLDDPLAETYIAPSASEILTNRKDISGSSGSEFEGEEAAFIGSVPSQDRATTDGNDSSSDGEEEAF